MRWGLCPFKLIARFDVRYKSHLQIGHSIAADITLIGATGAEIGEWTVGADGHVLPESVIGFALAEVIESSTDCVPAMHPVDVVRKLKGLILPMICAILPWTGVTAHANVEHPVQ